jgi:hypothetical protein
MSKLSKMPLGRDEIGYVAAHYAGFHGRYLTSFHGKCLPYHIFVPDYAISDFYL